MMQLSRVVSGLILLFTTILAPIAFAGNALLVGGPSLGKDAQPFRWNPAAMPIHYTVDSGALSKVRNNTYGREMVNRMFQLWQDVPTATISFTYSGAVFGSDGQPIADVSTVDQLDDVMATCDQGKQNPVIFDADGSIAADLGMPDAVGFTTPCRPTSTTDGYYTGAALVMNGKFIDGDSSSNGEIPLGLFNTAITHEIGHLAGLGHSQANGSILGDVECGGDLAAGLPLMFPVAVCAPPDDSDMPTLAADDLSELSQLYPNDKTLLTYGTLSGRIFFSDGVSQVQGVNVVARRVDDPNTPQDESLQIVISAVSGNLFTGNPGQTLTGDNPGYSDGSRNPDYRGYFEMLVPAGTYTLEVESVDRRFVGGSSVGPLSPPAPLPGPVEYWNQDESAYDFPLQRDTITVHAGQVIDNLNIILNGTAPRLDNNESRNQVHGPLLAWSQLEWAR